MIGGSITILHRLVGLIGSIYLYSVGKTSIVRRSSHPIALQIRRNSKPAIYAFWHRHQVFLAYHHRGEPIQMLVSQSQDGEYIAQVLKYMRIGTVRGSSSRSGADSLRKLIRHLKEGRQAGFTPDGPKGPLQTVHGGLIAAAKISQCPIIPLAVAVRRKIVFNSWDKFILPLPFNTIVVSHGEPIHIAPEVQHEVAAEKIRSCLNKMEEQAERELTSLPSFTSRVLSQMFLMFYPFVLIFLIPFLFPYLLLKYGIRRSLQMWWERILPPRVAESSQKKLWFHVASFGEWQALYPIYKELDKLNKYDFLVSTNAPDARRLIEDQLSRGHVCLAPLDIFFLPSWWVHRVRPDVLFLIEKEFWPKLLHAVDQSKIPILVINGRFSEKSIRKWRFFPGLASTLFGLPYHYYVRSEKDQNFFSRLGVQPNRMTVTGNVKYDMLCLEDEVSRGEKRQRLLRIPKNDFCVIGGSTWEGEEEALIDLPHRLIIAPRRLARLSHVQHLLKMSGRSWSLYSQVKLNKEWKSEILLVDTMGDLKDLYAAANVAFVGGSIIDRGGQSPLEPAAVGIPILFGEHMENFQLEAEALVNGKGARVVKNNQELRQAVHRLHQNPEECLNMGKSAQLVIQQNQGVTQRIVESILELIGESHD